MYKLSFEAYKLIKGEHTNGWSWKRYIIVRVQKLDQLFLFFSNTYHTIFYIILKFVGTLNTENAIIKPTRNSLGKYL